MSISINQGYLATFTVQFIDGKGLTFTPSSGVLTITYTNTLGSTAVAVINLQLSNPGIFTGVWDTGPAALGLANYTITSSSLVSPPAGTGQVRIVTP